MELDLNTLGSDGAYRFMISAVVPRPIAFVSTLSASGIRNLAPFSYFMGMGSNPPMVAVSIGVHADGPKDTVRNVRELPELVINTVGEEISGAMAVASGEYAPEEDEFVLAGLTPEPSARVAPPRVAESPVSFECKAIDIREYGNTPSTLVVCEIVWCRVRDDVYLADRQRVDTMALHPVARLGGPYYTRVTERHEIPRPDIRRRPPGK